MPCSLSVILPVQSRVASPYRESFPIADNKFRVVLDVSEVPELATWARETLNPVVEDWYPKIIPLLPSPNYSPPKSFTITSKRDMPGVANTAGTRITAVGPVISNTFRIRPSVPSSMNGFT